VRIVGEGGREEVLFKKGVLTKRSKSEEEQGEEKAGKSPFLSAANQRGGGKRDDQLGKKGTEGAIGDERKKRARKKIPQKKSKDYEEGGNRGKNNVGRGRGDTFL